MRYDRKPAGFVYTGKKLGGTISGEHGIGLIQKAYGYCI